MSREEQIAAALREALSEYRLVELTPEVKAEIHRRVYAILGKLYEYEILFTNRDITQPDEITINITGAIKHGENEPNNGRKHQTDNRGTRDPDQKDI